MPYLHCSRCHRTAWMRSRTEPANACRHCGAKFDAMAGRDARFLTAVRERLARDARRNAGPPRFIRDPHRLSD